MVDTNRTDLGQVIESDHNKTNILDFGITYNWVYYLLIEHTGPDKWFRCSNKQLGGDYYLNNLLNSLYLLEDIEPDKLIELATENQINQIPAEQNQVRECLDRIKKNLTKELDQDHIGENLEAFQEYILACLAIRYDQKNAKNILEYILRKKHCSVVSNIRIRKHERWEEIQELRNFFEESGLNPY